VAGEGGHDGGGDGQAETGGQLEPGQGAVDLQALTAVGTDLMAAVLR
jgi:hypothetical protein